MANPNFSFEAPKMGTPQPDINDDLLSTDKKVPDRALGPVSHEEKKKKFQDMLQKTVHASPDDEEGEFAMESPETAGADSTASFGVTNKLEKTSDTSTPFSSLEAPKDIPEKAKKPTLNPTPPEVLQAFEGPETKKKISEVSYSSTNAPTPDTSLNAPTPDPSPNKIIYADTNKVSPQAVPEATTLHTEGTITKSPTESREALPTDKIGKQLSGRPIISHDDMPVKTAPRSSPEPVKTESKSSEISHAEVAAQNIPVTPPLIQAVHFTKTETPTPSASQRIDTIRIVEQMIDKLTQVLTTGKTETTVTLKEPPLFAGTSIVITEFASAKKEFNIAFYNITTPEARALIEMRANQETLRAQLLERGYTLHMITLEPKQKIETASVHTDESEFTEGRSMQQKGKQSMDNSGGLDATL